MLYLFIQKEEKELADFLILQMQCGGCIWTSTCSVNRRLFFYRGHLGIMLVIISFL